MSSNKKYNITESKKVDNINNIPSEGNSIIYPKIDNSWYTMDSDGNEIRISGDVLFNKGFIQDFGDYQPYSSSVELDLGYGLTYSGNKIVVDPLSVQLEDQNNKFMYIDFTIYINQAPLPWVRQVFNPNNTIEYQINEYFTNNNLIVLDDEIPIFNVNVVELGTFKSKIHKYTLPHNFGKGNYSPIINYFTYNDIVLIYKDVDYQDPNPDDIITDINNVVFDLGDITGVDLYDYVNSYPTPYDITQAGYLYYFKFISNDITYMYYFDIDSSQNGYGYYGLNNLQFVPNELVLFYNSSINQNNQIDISNNVGITYDIYLHDISGVSTMDDLTDLKLSNYINSLNDPIIVSDINTPVYFRVYESPFITFKFLDITNLDGVTNLDNTIFWSDWFYNNFSIKYNNGFSDVVLDKFEYDITTNTFKFYSYDFTASDATIISYNNDEARKILDFDINFIKNFDTILLSYGSLSYIDLDGINILDTLELGSINLQNIYGVVNFNQNTNIKFYDTIENFDYLLFLKNNVIGDLSSIYFIGLLTTVDISLYGLNHLESLNYIYIDGLSNLNSINILNIDLTNGFEFDDLYLCDDITIKDCNMQLSYVQDIIVNLDGNGQSNGYLDLRGNEPIGASYSSLISLQNKGWVVHIDLI